MSNLNIVKVVQEHNIGLDLVFEGMINNNPHWSQLTQVELWENIERAKGYHSKADTLLKVIGRMWFQKFGSWLPYRGKTINEEP